MWFAKRVRFIVFGFSLWNVHLLCLVCVGWMVEMCLRSWCRFVFVLKNFCLLDFLYKGGVFVFFYFVLDVWWSRCRNFAYPLWNWRIKFYRSANKVFCFFVLYCVRAISELCDTKYLHCNMYNVIFLTRDNSLNKFLSLFPCDYF